MVEMVILGIVRTGGGDGGDGEEWVLVAEDDGGWGRKITGM